MTYDELYEHVVNYVAIPCIYDLPEDSEIRQRYEMLEHMKKPLLFTLGTTIW